MKTWKKEPLKIRILKEKFCLLKGPFPVEMEIWQAQRISPLYTPDFLVEHTNFEEQITKKNKLTNGLSEWISTHCGPLV